MSGTSLDGVDAALVRILTDDDGAVGSVELLRHSYIPYAADLRSLVSKLCSREDCRIDELVYAHYGLAEWYAAAVLLVIEEAGLSPSMIDVVSMHGQTVWHAPLPRAFPGPRGEVLVKGTLQLGASAVVRERVGLPVVADLRARDMAAGGEGAPLAPYIDAILFGSATEARAVQNIGGIGNVTVLPAGANKAAADSAGIFAFDTGPGNMVIDAVAAAVTEGKERFDPEGSIAAKGRVSEALVGRLMSDPYFARKPPKSTGREIYGAVFAAAFMKEARSLGLGPQDMAATATAFTAESIAAAYRDFVLPRAKIGTVFIAGGGARNPTLLGMIGERLPKGIRVATSEEAGVPDQAREAMAFALLGHESLMGRPGNLPAVTGARAPVVLGSLTL
jgi:anhydro-N-acetylmuramic acid kinase